MYGFFYEGANAYIELGNKRDYEFTFKGLNVKNILKSLKAHGKLLDIGCGVGTIVKNINGRKDEFEDLKSWDFKVIAYGITANDNKRDFNYDPQYSDKILIADATSPHSNS